uniref:Cilia- and flagella-associated protein 58 central coiled coil domain-containing protein n=1 Tax=Micromonas pusilla TaxID=38833 RepID=A0A6U0N663_MICPS|mmetsp:Transcript_11465/g.48005  ORF Transcript_11465/g.48005 Transcript_11465/m.48005 type:complete len:868 (+) Transcript_11465:190-2793(+)
MSETASGRASPTIGDRLTDDFNKVIAELENDPAMAKFKEEYENVFSALVNSNDSEKRLVQKCRDLNAEIVANAAKVQSALKLADEDQGTIDKLKGEVEKAWKMVDASKEKETRAKENVQALKKEVADLSKAAAQGGSGGAKQQEQIKDMMRQRDELAAERDEQVNQIVMLREEVMEVTEQLRAAEADKLRMENELQILRDDAASAKAATDKETKRKEKMERDMKELKELLEEKTYEIKQKQHSLKEGDEAVKRLEKLLKDQQGATSRAQKDYNGLSDKLAKLQRDLSDAVQNNANLAQSNANAQIELKAKDDEINLAKLEAGRIDKAKDAALGKLRAAEAAKAEVEKNRDDLKRTIADLERDIDAMRKQGELEKKKQEELMRERDVLTKLKSQAESATQKQADLVRITENNKKTLEQEIAGYRSEASKQAKAIFGLEQEREKFANEASATTAKFLEALEEVKMREMAIVDLQKSIADGNAKLKAQQSMYEAVRTDRNMYSKNLLEAQDEIAEMKRKFKIMNHQIEQLKEEISTKDLALVKEHFDHMKVEKEKESLRFELDKAAMNIKEAESSIAAQKLELQRLNRIIDESDAAIGKQEKELVGVVNDRDILGTQLIRRNDELALLYEKIKIQGSILAKGQIQYQDRLNELRVLKIKLGDLKRELGVLKHSVGSIAVLKREVHRLGKELLQERTKTKALTEELENPLNVHRWRKLEGSDPTAYEMIQKIQALQKRLIAKTEEVVEKDLLVREKEKLYKELKAILARQPGPEVAEQVSVYQRQLREKTRQMKAMASELNMYQAQSSEYKYEVDKLTRDLGDVKKKYFDHKRRQEAERGADRENAGGKRQTAQATARGGARFTGGGFGLN